MNKYRLRIILLFGALLLGIFFVADTLLGVPKVNALGCKYYPATGICGWTGWNSSPKPCSAGDPGAREMCCWWNPSKPNCGETKSAPCGNCRTVCGGSGGPPPCSCNPVSCPPSTPPSKFMQTGHSNGNGRSCGDPCNPNNYTCPQTYRNTAPTCSMLPTSITMNRSDAPRQFTLTTRDADWGDTVKIAGVEVVDTAGNLKSCVDIKTLTGNSIGNLVVRPGSDNAALLSSTIQLIADPRSAYGIYNDNNVCSGIVRLQIRDIDSDGNGPDASDTVTCTMNITVTNDAPQISAIDIRDKDFVPTLRRAGNLATQYRSGDGNGNLPVGSLWDTRRVARCTAPVDLSNNYGECSAWEPKATRTNPYSVAFTVTDAQGLNDIKDVGLWIQRSDAAANPAIPLVSNATRKSIQALVGQRSNYQIENPYYFTAAPCLGASCTENITKQSLLGYSLIVDKGQYTPSNGTVSRSGKQSASYKEWLQKGFPNCLFQGTGTCTGSNVPNVSKNNAGGDASVWANYDWTSSADRDHMMCLSSTSNTTSVIPRSSNGTCPSTCAACVALDKIEANATSPTRAVDVSFLVWMNDRYINSGAGGAGMEEGRYEVFVGARDVVAGNAYGANFWRTVGGTGNRFALTFDAVPPIVSGFALSVEQGANGPVILGVGNIQETQSTATGVAGWGNRFMMKEDLLDFSKPKEFLTNPMDNSLWNGTDWPVTGDLTGTGTSRAFSYRGAGVPTDTPTGIMGGFCTYDRAGNMCCVKSVFTGTNTVAKRECANYSTSGILEVGVPWVQTTLGSVYSNTSTNSSAFEMSVSALARSITDPLNRVPAAIDQTRGVSLGGVFVTGSETGGITGAFNNSPLGYNRDARTEINSDLRNIFGISDVENRDWYTILYALVRKNCDLTGQCYDPSGKSLQTIESQGLGYFEITDATNTGSLNCNGKHVVFIKGTVTLGEVKKSTATSSCLFVLGRGAVLKVEDLDQKPLTSFDRFDASVVVSDGGTFETIRVPAFSRASDRLQIYGFLFSDNASSPPKLNRELDMNVSDNDNFYYSSEWFVYDANVLSNLRILLGYHRTADVVCGTSDHVLCSPR